MRNLLRTALLLSLITGMSNTAFAGHVTLTKADAAHMVETLPELRQLARLVKSSNGDKAKVVILNDSEALEKIGRSSYWDFDIYVQLPNDLERWGSIMVRTDGQGIIVSDFDYQDGEETPYPVWHQWEQQHGLY